MFLRTVCCPDLILESSSLTFNMLERTNWVRTRVELAHGLGVSELAVWCRAIGTIAARRHGRVFERASYISAIRVEFAFLLVLEGDLLRRRWVLARAFSILARSPKRTHIPEIDSCTWRSCRRLMCEFAILVCAGKVVSAGGILRVDLLLFL